MDTPVEVRDAGLKGRGVFALRDFERGDVILQFERGRVVHANELATLTPWERMHLGELAADTCQVLPAWRPWRPIRLNGRAATVGTWARSLP
jgi:hypothetical protein